MQPLSWERRPDGLRAPALVCAFKGWNDAGESRPRRSDLPGRRRWTPRASPDRPRGLLRLPGHAAGGAAGGRPHARDRVARGRDLRGAHAARPARPRPALRARAVDALAHLLRHDGRARRGARRPARGHPGRAAGRRAALAAGARSPGMASDHGLIQRLGLQAPTYEGPTGIVGVLHAACADAGLPSASLWAGVPHYVAAAPNPKAALALLRRLERPRRRVGRRLLAGGGRGRLRAPGLARGGDATRRCRPSSSAWRRRPTRRRAPPIRTSSPRATCWRGSSSGSCGSAGIAEPVRRPSGASQTLLTANCALTGNGSTDPATSARVAGRESAAGGSTTHCYRAPHRCRR